MSAHESPPIGRVLRTDRCGCREYPQAYTDTRRGTTWFSCNCGRIAPEAKTTASAIENWNELIWRGEQC